jgi:hypothetical protein
MNMTEERQPDATDHAFALVEQVNRLAKIAPTMADWEHGKDTPSGEQLSAARAIVSGGNELRKSLWALETVAESIVKAHDDAQEKRLDAFFETTIEGV